MSLAGGAGKGTNAAVVEETLRGRGVGSDLTTALLGLAHEAGIRSVFLLTTTAADFFIRFGFERVSRDTAPAEIRASAEFMTLCPTSATLMRKDFQDG